MTQRSLILTALLATGLCGVATAQTSTVIVAPADPAVVVVPAPAPVTPTTTYSYTNEPASVPRTRAEVQAEGSATLHGGGVARGEAQTTRNRPHGGPMNADAPTTGAGAGQTNGINGWSNGPQGDGG